MIARAAHKENRPRPHIPAGGRAVERQHLTARPDSSAPVVLTDRGRVRAVLVRLERRWDALTPNQRAEARALVDRLADTYRKPTAVRVPLVGRMAV